MDLLHNTFGTNPIEILKSGKLLSSAKTKNIKLFGRNNAEGSPFIFLRLQRKRDNATFHLDHKLLLETKFYLHIGWRGDPEGKIIDGTKLTPESQENLLTEFGDKVDENYKKVSKRIALPQMMSNEILVMSDIDLHKYLKKVNVKYSVTKEECKQIKEWYPNIKLIKPSK